MINWNSRRDTVSPGSNVGQRPAPSGASPVGADRRPPYRNTRHNKDRDTSHDADPATGAFVAHRNLLFTVAYEILGSAADAEDVLQETWLRWVKVHPERVRDERAYLVRVTTWQALDRLRTVRRRREAYVGPWLPEPLLTAPDAAEDPTSSWSATAEGSSRPRCARSSARRRRHVCSSVAWARSKAPYR